MQPYYADYSTILPSISGSLKGLNEIKKRKSQPFLPTIKSKAPEINRMLCNGEITIPQNTINITDSISKNISTKTINSTICDNDFNTDSTKHVIIKEEEIETLKKTNNYIDNGIEYPPKIPNRESLISTDNIIEVVQDPKDSSNLYLTGIKKGSKYRSEKNEASNASLINLHTNSDKLDGTENNFDETKADERVLLNCNKKQDYSLNKTINQPEYDKNIDIKNENLTIQEIYNIELTERQKDIMSTPANKVIKLRGQQKDFTNNEINEDIKFQYDPITKMYKGYDNRSQIYKFRTTASGDYTSIPATPKINNHTSDTLTNSFKTVTLNKSINGSIMDITNDEKIEKKFKDNIELGFGGDFDKYRRNLKEKQEKEYQEYLESRNITNILENPNITSETVEEIKNLTNKTIDILAKTKKINLEKHKNTDYTLLYEQDQKTIKGVLDSLSPLMQKRYLSSLSPEKAKSLAKLCGAENMTNFSHNAGSNQEGEEDTTSFSSLKRQCYTLLERSTKDMTTCSNIYNKYQDRNDVSMLELLDDDDFYEREESTFGCPKQIVDFYNKKNLLESNLGNVKTSNTIKTALSETERTLLKDIANSTAKHVEYTQKLVNYDKDTQSKEKIESNENDTNNYNSTYKELAIKNPDCELCRTGIYHAKCIINPLKKPNPLLITKMENDVSKNAEIEQLNELNEKNQIKKLRGSIGLKTVVFGSGDGKILLEIPTWDRGITNGAIDTKLVDNEKLVYAPTYDSTQGKMIANLMKSVKNMHPNPIYTRPSTGTIEKQKPETKSEKSAIY